MTYRALKRVFAEFKLSRNDFRRCLIIKRQYSVELLDDLHNKIGVGKDLTAGLIAGREVKFSIPADSRHTDTDLIAYPVSGKQFLFRDQPVIDTIHGNKGAEIRIDLKYKAIRLIAGVVRGITS